MHSYAKSNIDALSRHFTALVGISGPNSCHMYPFFWGESQFQQICATILPA